jgi:hypothetical protein
MKATYSLYENKMTCFILVIEMIYTKALIRLALIYAISA